MDYNDTSEAKVGKEAHTFPAVGVVINPETPAKEGD